MSRRSNEAAVLIHLFYYSFLYYHSGMRNAGIIIAVLLSLAGSAFMGRLAWQYNKQATETSARLQELNLRLMRANAQNAALEDERQYLNNPENLEKELKNRGNWRKQDEKMIIVVPAQQEASTTRFNQ